MTIKKQKTYAQLLQGADRSAINHLLRVKPTDLELEFLAMVNVDKLKMRPYLETIMRLDDGVRNHINPVIQCDNGNSILISGGTKLLLQNGRMKLDVDFTLREQAIFGNHLQVYYSDISKPNNTVINKFLRQGRASKIKKLGGNINVPDQGQEYTLLQTAAVGTNEKNSFVATPPSAGTEIFCVTAGNSWKNPKSDFSINSLIKTIKGKPWLSGVKIIDEKGLGTALVNFAQTHNVGISVKITGINAKNLVGKLRDWGAYEDILVFIQAGCDKKIKKYVKESSFKVRKIGVIQKDGIFSVSGQKKSFLSLSIPVFDYYKISFDSVHHIQTPDQKKTTDFSKIKEKRFYSSPLKILLSRFAEERKSWNLTEGKPRKVIRSMNYGLVSSVVPNSGMMVFTAADNDYFTSFEPRLSGKLTVANAVRQIVCRGAKPVAISIRNIFPDLKEGKDHWKGIEILKGQEEAVRVLGLTIANRHILPFTDQCVQHITSVGFIPENQTPMTGGLKQEGDFISILGSHRGELGGTKYMQNFYPDIRVNPPTVDLAMEPRIHEVLLKSIQEGFIQSAYNVSAGGLAVAIALSLISGEEGIGARIHLSRKIRNDELLFGETQGLILISFEENNFIKFERICMQNNIPATTIGRVTGDGKFTFNNLINVQVKDMKNLMTIV